MISFSAYREKAIAIREERLGRKYNPEKRADDKAFERIMFDRYTKGLEPTEALVGIGKKRKS